MRSTLKTSGQGGASARRRAFALGCAFAMLAFAGGSLAAGTAGAGTTTTHHVVIDGLQYLPGILTVKRGDTIVWTNNDPFPHTVTAAGTFDSHDIAAGASWKYIARKAGQYDYICTLHPNMKATLRVE